MAVELIAILLLILANGLFAMSEMAVVSARKTRLEQWAAEGNKRARAALTLSQTPNRFLSTVQIGITLVGILSGAFGGATLAERIGNSLRRIPWIGDSGPAVALALVVLLITYLSLVFGELVPKRLALNNPERIAVGVAIPMQALAALTAPVSHVLAFSTEAVFRLLGIQPSTEPPVTEEELKVMLQQGTEAGIFEAAEQDMVENVFRLNDRRVSAVMTPHPDIVWLDVNEPLAELRRKIIESAYSRFPVCRGDLDNLLGVVRTKDLLARALNDQPLDLLNCLRSPLFVPEGMPVSKVLQLFRNSKTHIALVIDEYGSIQGLVTLKDLLEAIVGEITPGIAFDHEPEVVQREDGSWLVDGMLPIDEFKELFDLEMLPDEERSGYQTLGGFVMSQLGRIPQAGDHFEWQTLHFEVMDMDERRVDKVLVARQPSPPADKDPDFD